MPSTGPVEGRLCSPPLEDYWRALRKDPRLMLHAAIYSWAAEIFDPGWVLDVGCEYAFGSVLLTETNPELRVMGCDIQFQPLRKARQITADSSVALIQAAAATLPLAGNSLSGICLFNIIHLVEKPSSILQEAGRLLCAGKHAVITLPLSDRTYPSFQTQTPAEYITQLANPVFCHITFPTVLTIHSSILPSGEYRIAPDAHLLVALCRKGPIE